MRKKFLFLKILIAGLVAIIFTLAIFWRPDVVSRREHQDLAYDFTLQNVAGDIRLTDLTLRQNKYVLLYFGYTYCPDICPSSLLTLSEALNFLPENVRDRFQLLFISLDPQRDNLKHLQEYGEFFYKDILTATTLEDKNLRQIAANYKIIYRKHFDDNAEKNLQNYSIDHSSNIIVISPENKWIWTFQHGISAEKIAEILKRF